MLTSPSKILLVMCCGALFLGPLGARAEGWLYFQPITGQLSVGFDGRWTNTDTGGSTQQTKYEERLRLNLGGYGLDPRIFTFNVNLEPALTQEKSDSGFGTVSSDGTFLNYAAQFSALQGVAASPISLSGNLSASSGQTEGSLGSRSDVTMESRGASLNWNFIPFRSTVSYQERTIDETYIPGFGLTPTVHNNTERTLSYRGRSSGMELLLDRTEYDDLTPADQDYDSQRARLNNNFRWGKNSSLWSRLEYLDREGFNAEEKASVDESLRLQHTRNLFTTYSYAYQSLHRTVDTETQSGAFGLNHQLYTNLNTSFRLSGSTVRSDVLQRDSYGATLDFGYHKQFRPDLKVTANLGGGYTTTSSTGGQLDSSESPSVPATGIVVLAERYILWPTIIVTAPGCNPCAEGPDYIVSDAGGDFTQLTIPVGSAINIGDVITVDYAYQPPAVEYYAIPYRIGFRVDYRSFGFYHRTSGESQTFVSGPDPTAVGDQRTDTTGIEWNWRQGRSFASVSAERRYSETVNRATTEYLVRQRLAYVLAPNATLNANFSESFYRNSDSVDAYNADLSIQWYPWLGLSVRPRLSAFRRTTEPDREDTFVKAGVDVRWNWRRLSADLSYDHTEQETNGLARTEDRVFLTLKRKF